MAKKRDDNTIRFSEVIFQKPMEEVMHDSMIPYSEYVILERALPRVEDGLKPVQRRILFAMHELGNTADKPHRKCARIVGECLGKYHPHGDTSVYDALARMAQPFVMRAPLVDGHGNFGSIDGDSPAAMRYTEARMTELAEVLLQDIDKDTVGFHLNFDDTQKEPDLLPGRFPNLLVNGSSGIAVGLATNIPPHNLGEAIDGAIALMRNPEISTEELMRYIPAPDFPTGGVLSGDGELRSAYETGRGKLSLRCKVELEKGTAGRTLIVIREVPYQVNKAAMLEKILRLSEEKKALLGGIYDIRDESDRQGMRAVIELKRDVDAQKVLNALYKYSDMQVTFGVNMVAIADGKPRLMGLREMLSHYIRHQKDVVTRRTRHELEQAEARAHILEGLIVAVDNLDEVIRLIRGSKNPKEAREKLVARFALSEIQAQAILDMRLQRLTNLEILSLRREHEEIQKLIKRLKGILASEKKLIEVIERELLEIREKFADSRRTQIVDSFEKIVIEEEAPVADEAVVQVTSAGFIKRLPKRLFEKTQEEKEACRWTIEAMTDEKILFFTNLGNCYPIALAQIPECRIKDRGLPPGGLLAGLEKEEQVVSVLHPGKWDGEWVLFSELGLCKRVKVQDLMVRKAKYAAIGLREGDRLLTVFDAAQCPSILCVSRSGMAIHFPVEEISVLGRTAAGVKAMQLNPGDRLIAAFAHNSEGEVLLATDLGYMKRCLLIDFDRQARGGKGLKAISFLKNGMNGSEIACALPVKEPFDFTAYQRSGASTRCNTEDIDIETRSGKGQPVILVVMDDFVEKLV
ncbi:MAG TPA: DNA topoisomerase (ATP-hydrolyzing) subunit A [Candidatus Pullichristensenella excrementigallinarum]|uniref:DNA topoisomerase (ATP-hydrolyzing) n=1 Tax=Candidatus Pullichristensenella excrementigallinarum TaxID=2840907 RepID=A0A9D1IEG4_9FIRM|nr:DNA topoisomerase (ATP-hydrolyzing) subunit A [Candidatus Pullichristensenella excrementigallinarum]